MKTSRSLFWVLLFLLYPLVCYASEVTVDRFLNDFTIRDCALDGDYVWCATEDHGIIRFDVRDESWTEVIPENVSPAERYLSVAVDRDGVKWFGAPTGIYRYDGATWQRFHTETGLVPGPNYELAVTGIFADNDNFMWFVDFNNGIAEYDGTAWQVVSILPGVTGWSVDPNTNEKWFCSGMAGNILTCDETGVTLYKPEDLSPFFNPYDLWAMAADRDSRIWVGGADGVFSRYDGGTWSSPPVGYPPVIQTMRFDSSGRLWLGTDLGLWLYENEQIQEMKAVINQEQYRPSLNDVEFASNGDMWAVAYAGSQVGLLRYRLSMVVEVEENSGPREFEISEARPNPFNPATTISFHLPKSAAATLTIHDALGQKIATLVNGPMSAGTHSVTFNGAKLASGVYFYRFESAGTAKTGKMLLLK